MRLEIEKTAELTASVVATWDLIHDVPRLAGCVPGVTDFQALNDDRCFAATLSDKIGPFSLSVPMEIEIIEVDELRHLAAVVRGSDRKGQARVKGTLEAHLSSDAEHTLLLLGTRLDVSGRLATLGAVPMRRRADQIFGEFTRRVATELERASSSAAAQEIIGE